MTHHRRILVKLILLTVGFVLPPVVLAPIAMQAKVGEPLYNLWFLGLLLTVGVIWETTMWFLELLQRKTGFVFFFSIVGFVMFFCFCALASPILVPIRLIALGHQYLEARQAYAKEPSGKDDPAVARRTHAIVPATAISLIVAATLILWGADKGFICLFAGSMTACWCVEALVGHLWPSKRETTT